MHYVVKLLGLVGVTAVIVPLAEVPGFPQESQSLPNQQLAQTQITETIDVLLEVEGVLDEGDNTYSDGTLYEQHIIEGRAGQTLSITLESLDFHTSLFVFDEQGNEIATAYDGGIYDTLDGSIPDFHSFLTITLPADGTYYVVANVYTNEGLSLSWLLSDQGHYRLVVVEESSTESGPFLSDTILDRIANITDRNSEANQLFSQGVQEFEDSQFQLSMRSLEQALAIYREIGNVARELVAGENLIETYQALGRYDELTALNQEQTILIFNYFDTPDDENNPNYTGLLWLRGTRLSRLAQYEEALKVLEQARSLSNQRGESRIESIVVNQLAKVYREMGQYRLSIDFYHQALAINQKIGSHAGEAEDLVGLGNTYYVVGQYEQAIDLFHQALDIAQAVNYQDLEPSIFSGLGSAYAALKDYERAIDFHQQALAVDHEGDSSDVSLVSLSGLGNIYFALGDYGRAIEFHQQVLEDSRRHMREADAIDRPINISGRISERSTLHNLANAHSAQGNYELAFDFYQQSLTISRAVDDRLLEANTLSNLGAMHISANQFAQAEVTLQQSMAVFESLRTDLSDAELIAIADTQANTYTLSVLAVVAQNKTAEALAIAERGRARAFVLQLANRLSSSPNQGTIATAPAIAEIQRIARDTNSTLVTYSQIVDQALYIWVVQPSGEIAFRSVEFDGSGDAGLAINPIASIDGPVYRSANPDSALIALVTDSRSLSGVEASSNSNTPQLQELHEVLIDPIADLLPSDPNAQVVFIPQGELFLVPFAALQDDDGTYLIEKHTILTAPSIQVFGLASEAGQESGVRSQESDNALIVGNPTMPTVWLPTEEGDFAETQLSYLSGAETEAEAIGEFFNIPVLTGEQATEARIKQELPNASLIHLATHGLLEYGIPESSGVLDVPGAVALAPGDGEDGLLTSAEILEMDLQADLAILSACDTGRGRITGDGVVGLSRALITAGVPSVMVSLWAVNDDSTSVLMQRFYEILTTGEFTKAEALRQAQLSLLYAEDVETRLETVRAGAPPMPREGFESVGTRHPYHWAPFVLIGNGR